MPETTFERVRSVVVSSSEKEINPDNIRPDSTLLDLGLIEYFWGAAPLYVGLEDEFKKDNPNFEFPDEEINDSTEPSITIQQIVGLVEKGLEKAAASVTR